ncbi:Transcriptional regulatory protein DegU [Paraburkholderia ultramafica]|uniref:Transcriptional regulatory protein DegU n=2 Tax=Paraburkholderia ultramafica TaxID=1544867 RepID=A0A6S7D1F7_9BURK|nr:Transcriptional regulatory protein DegU [Paraburkholderia ultramafica]
MVTAMKILIVDDHPVFRDGISALLTQDSLDAVVLQAGSGAEALMLVNEHADLDVVLLDLMLPGAGGLQVITEVAELRPELPVIMLSSSEDPHDARDAFAHGALGYVPKSSSRYALLSAIKLVLNGELYVPTLVLDAGIDAPATVLAPASAAQEEGIAVLTQRQIEVLRLIGDGCPNKKIATGLGLSEKTVKAHITAIFKALKVANRTQAAAAGRKAGLI